jgi:hypothetical protein
MAHYLRTLPEARAGALYDADTGAPTSLKVAVDAVGAAATLGQRLLVVDDVDLLMPASREALLAEVLILCGAGYRVVLTARTSFSDALEVVALPGLDAAGLEQCLASAMASSTHSDRRPRQLDVQALLESTQGVPLFALEWSADLQQPMSLPVLLAVASELKRYRLDWRLLQVLNEVRAPCTFERLQVLTAMPRQEIEGQVRAAVGAGLLQLSEANEQRDLDATPVPSGLGGRRWVGFANALVQHGVAGILV